MRQHSQPNIDWDFFEYVIAYHCTMNEIYLATVIDMLKMKYLQNDQIKSYLTIIFDFYKRNSSLPSPTEIKSLLANDTLKDSYKHVITNFKDIDANCNSDELLLNTERFIKERAVFFAVKDTVSQVTGKGDVDTSTIFKRFEDACNISLVENLGFDYFEQIDQHIDDLVVENKYLSTGYSWLDKALGGGFLERGRSIYVFTGATNAGKSIVLGNVAANLALPGKTVVIITLEMSEMIYAKRLSAKLTGIPLNVLKSEANQLKELVLDLEKKHNGAKIILKEFPPKSITVNNIKTYLKKLVNRRKIKIDAIIIDYLTLLLPTNITGNMYLDGKEIAEQLRALSYPENFGCPIISAAQLNREGYNKGNPGLETTGESAGIAHTADFMASVWSSEADKELGLIHMGIQKSRFGLNFGTCAFKINYDTLSIDETDDIFNDSDTVQTASNALSKIST